MANFKEIHTIESESLNRARFVFQYWPLFCFTTDVYATNNIETLNENIQVQFLKAILFVYTLLYFI